VDKSLVEMARVMGMKKGKVFRFITFPSIKPAYSAALVTGLGFAWKSGVAAEVISRTETSLGNLLWIGKNAIDYDEVFAVTAVIVVFSMIFEYLLKLTLKSGVAK
jgi:NitT/TauT family transport system permease protein